MNIKDFWWHIDITIHNGTILGGMWHYSFLSNPFHSKWCHQNTCLTKKALNMNFTIPLYGENGYKLPEIQQKPEHSHAWIPQTTLVYKLTESVCHNSYTFRAAFMYVIPDANHCQANHSQMWALAEWVTRSA